MKKNGVPIQATAWSKFCQTHEDTDYLPILIATVVALLSCFLITALIVLAVMYCKIRMKGEWWSIIIHAKQLSYGPLGKCDIIYFAY